jgi:hypothetical protein
MGWLSEEQDLFCAMRQNLAEVCISAASAMLTIIFITIHFLFKVANPVHSISSVVRLLQLEMYLLE